MAEVFTYAQILCSFLTIIQSLKNQESGDRITYEEQDWTFWVSFAVTVTSVVAVVIGYIIHKIYEEPKNQRTNIK